MGSESECSRFWGQHRPECNCKFRLPVTFDIADETIAKLLVTRAINPGMVRLDGNSTSMAVETAGMMVVHTTSIVGPTRVTGKFGKGLSLMERMIMHLLLDKGITGGNKRLILSG